MIKIRYNYRYIIISVPQWHETRKRAAQTQAYRPEKARWHLAALATCPAG